MNISEFSILTGGILSFAMLIFHMKFYDLFGWKTEFEKMQLKNRNIFYTIHIALILFFVIFSTISIVYYKELAVCTGPAFGITLLYSLFWLWRTIWQIFYFKYPEEIKSKPALHYIVILIFSLLLISYAIPVILEIGT